LVGQYERGRKTSPRPWDYNASNGIKVPPARPVI